VIERPSDAKLSRASMLTAVPMLIAVGASAIANGR
jgi:hypothetical protein